MEKSPLFWTTIRDRHVEVREEYWPPQGHSVRRRGGTELNENINAVESGRSVLHLLW